MVKTVHPAHKKIWILCLALAVTLLAPFKALSTPINAVADDSCVIVRACCATMQHCCCETSPTLPADVATAASLPAPPKFVSIKGSGRVISQELPRPYVNNIAHVPALTPRLQSGSNAVPLYILNRALLI
jgi:hypothetical protein